MNSRRFRPCSPSRLQTFRSAFPRRPRSAARAKTSPAKTPETQKPFPPPAASPAWARAGGRAGQGDPLFFAGAGLALLDACLRADPPAAGALRARLALKSAAASAKNPARQRRRSRAARPPASPSATAQARREPFDALARLRRPTTPLASTQAEIFDAAARLDLALPDPSGLAASLKACAGEGDPVSAAAKAATAAFSAVPDARAAEAEILALSVFDTVLAIRLRWPRPACRLIARRNLWTRPCDPRSRTTARVRATQAWPNAAAGADRRFAAASAVDLAAHLSRRSEILLAVAPKLRSKPAAKIVDLLLAEDCLSPARKG